jgi:Zn-dependent protease with chaperone function
LLTHVVGALRGFIPFAAAWLAVGPFAVSPGLVVKAAAAALGAVTTWHYATWVGASIAAHTMRSTVSRAVEYRADRGGARLAGDTEIMASSLRTLDIHNRQVNTLLGVATSFARTACGLGYEKAPNPAQRVLATVFADHPSNYYRIRKLNLEKQRSAVQGSGVSGVA